MTQPLNWDLTRNDDKIALRLTGELARNTLLPLWQQRDFLFKTEGQRLEIDLADVERLDSAGFALLCDFLHDGSARYAEVRLLNPPQQLLTLADLVNLTHFIAAFTDN